MKGQYPEKVMSNISWDTTGALGNDSQIFDIIPDRLDNGSLHMINAIYGINSSDTFQGAMDITIYDHVGNLHIISIYIARDLAPPYAAFTINLTGGQGQY
ncbi:MAG: hypothetical protein DRH44_08200, partial [Candidatus Coatesbacteria bacterium]